MRWLLFLVPLLFIGCEDVKSKTQEYLDFVEKHGSNTRFYCDDSGFLVMEFFMYSNDKVASRRLVKNDSDTPTICTQNVTVNVKETVATGAFSGSVQ